MIGILLGLAAMAAGAWLLVTRLPAALEARRTGSPGDGRPGGLSFGGPDPLRARLAGWGPVLTGLWLAAMGAALFGWNLLRLIEPPQG